MSKVKLWIGWTYDMKSINHIYNQENWSFDILHAWLGYSIGVPTVKWYKQLLSSKHPHEGKNCLPKNKIWLANFNHKCCNIIMFYSDRHLVFHLDLHSILHIVLHIDFFCENMLHAIIKFNCLHYPENTYHLLGINRFDINNEK